MMYKIIFRNQHEITMDLDEDEAQQIASQKMTMFENDGNYYNSKDVVMIEKSHEVPVSAGYLEEKQSRIERLSTPANEDFEKINVGGYMERLFDSMKSSGHFKNYSSYQVWEEQHKK